MPSAFLHFALFAATLLSSVTLGGGTYECIVIDPSWPRHPQLIQPMHGGIVRGRFWLLFHLSFEIVLVLCLIEAWRWPNVRLWLLLALASHAFARIWSAFDFIPKAVAFEKALSVDEASARRWTRRSRFRVPIALLTWGLLLSALIASFSR